MQPANQQLAPAPYAALQQQEVSHYTWKRGGASSAAATDRQTDRQSVSQAFIRTYNRHVSPGGSLFPRITMPLKNGNSVAAERRMDLASLFCMIGRHGPAVALAAIAMVSVLAGFIIYRTVRGKRRKATAAAAADGDGRSPGAERDPSVVQQSPEEPHSRVESTDVRRHSSDVKEDLIHSDLKIRHRRAAEKTPPPYFPPKSDIQVAGNKYPTTDDTEEVAVVWDSHTVAETYADEANQSLQSDTYTEAETVAEEAVDGHQGATDDAVKDVLEDVHDDNNSCWKEPEPINEKNNEEDNKVLTAECQDDEDVTTDKDVSDNTTREEEEDFQCALNNPVYFEQASAMSEISDRLQDDETTNSVRLEEPVIHTEEVSVPCVCDGKDEEFEEEKPDSIDYSCYSSNDHQSPEEEMKNEEAEEECVDHQAEIWSSTFERQTNLPSTEEDQCDHVTDKVAPESDWKDDVAEADDEVIDEDCLNTHTAVKFEPQMPHFEEQDVEIEHIEENGVTCDQEENGLTCDQEDGVLHDDQVKVNILSDDNIAPCFEECDPSSVSLSSALPCLSPPMKVDNQDDSLEDITTHAEAQISSIVDFLDLSLDCPQPQKEGKVAPALDEETDFIILAPEMMSHETENQLENNGNDTTMVLAEERNDQVNDPNVQSCDKDKQSVLVIGDEAFDEESVAAEPDTVDNLTSSVIIEEMSCSQLASICQDQQSDHKENVKTFEETSITSVTDLAACNNTSCTALLSSEEISHHDMSSSSKDQQSDHMEKNETTVETEVASACLTSPIMSEELSCPDKSSSQDQESDQTKNNDFSEVTTGAAPVMTEDINPPMCQINLPSFEEFELRDNDVSCAGVGEESGISSMAVSPDAGKEFDVIFENMVIPVIDCVEQTEAQISFFADDAAISVIKEETAGMVFGPYPSQPLHSEHKDWTNYESLAANEDTFGHEVEDSYHRAMDQFMAQVADGVSSFTKDLEKQTHVKVEVKVKEVRVSVEKKEEAKEEEQKEEDYEKTEISIMEATMDHNEWIMDSNYQPLPWMNLSAPSFAQDHTKTNQLPTEECNYSSAITVTTYADATDIPPSIEIKQTSPLALIDHSTENNEKFVPVQPMPQNVDVTFRVHYFTQSPYQKVAVTGNQQELGNWKGFIPLERAKDGHWTTVVSLPVDSIVEWKFVLMDKGEVCRWEECGNRLLDTGNGDDLLVHKWWGRL
ncbi:uncharacterized protein stbd1 [Centropristis striata]|uniref:uncharacterized protein stbd1 n=1 Tax=Centropristis striata TaxID=184440 RepID=UPI0027E1822E|nr:uncharacterized protein stbd1 [Centropristis striata]